MRIVSGEFGGRRLEVPKGNDIRPTSDKTRGAIFNILRARIDFENLNVMDLCCGTGALGIEALSQGAAFCIFVDSAKDSIDLAKRNIAAMKAESRAKFIQKDAAKVGEKPQDSSSFGLVFLDPPYNKNIIPGALAALHEGGWLADEALCVVESEKDWRIELPENFKMIDERLYGETKIILCQYQA
jgi:16S rRNA (guanine966-N2)-methyltransferase